MKARSDDVLSKLPEDQQIRIYDWLLELGYSTTIQKLAEPAPDGFALKTHRASLHRFFKRYQQKLRSDDIAAARENRSSPEEASVLVSDAEQSVQYAAQQLA